MQELDPRIFTGPDLAAILQAYTPIITVSVVALVLLIFRFGFLRFIPPDSHPRLAITGFGLGFGAAVLALIFVLSSNAGVREGVDRLLQGTSELIFDPLDIFTEATDRCPIINSSFPHPQIDIADVLDPFLQLYDSIFTSVVVLLFTFLTHSAVRACWKPSGSTGSTCLARLTMASLTSEVVVAVVMALLVVVLSVLHTVGSVGITVCPRLDKLKQVFNNTGIRQGFDLLDRCDRNASELGVDSEFLDAVSILGFDCQPPNNTLFCSNQTLPCANVTDFGPFEHFCSCTDFLGDVTDVLSNCSGVALVFEDYFCVDFLDSLEVLYIATIAVIFSMLLVMIFGKQILRN